MSNQEAEENGLDNRPVSFKLDTGEVVVVQSDDEGNNGGSLCVIKKGKIRNFTYNIERKKMSKGYATLPKRPFQR